MKQFSVKDYLANPSLKVVTREGRPVRIVCTDAKGYYPVVALAIDDDGSEYTVRCRKDGIGGFDEDDLFFAPEKKEAWANLYFTELGTLSAGEFFKTKEFALKRKVKDRGKYLTTFKVEWEE